MRKKLVITFCTVALMSGLMVAGVIKKTSAVNLYDTRQIAREEVEQEEMIPEETINYDSDNEYVELNNELVQAINDYSEGNISKEEYLEICKKISKKINTEKEENKIKEEEEEYFQESFE